MKDRKPFVRKTLEEQIKHLDLELKELKDKLYAISLIKENDFYYTGYESFQMTSLKNQIEFYENILLRFMELKKYRDLWESFGDVKNEENV